MSTEQGQLNKLNSTLRVSAVEQQQQNKKKCEINRKYFHICRTEAKKRLIPIAQTQIQITQKIMLSCSTK